MKKLISAALLALLVIALPLSFVGCKNQSGASDPIVGSWRHAGYQDINISTGEVIDEETYEQGKSSIITFHKNKTVTSEGGKIKATWKKDGETYIVSYNKDGKSRIQTFYIKDGKLFTEYTSSTVKSTDFYEKLD